MARQRTGTVLRTRDGRYQPQVWIAFYNDEGRKAWRRKRLPPFDRGTSKAYARERTLFLQQKAEEMGAQMPEERPVERQAVTVGDMPCDAWVSAWLASRRARGQTSVSDDESRWEHHIRAVLGHKHPADWTPDDLRQLVSTLDDKARAGTMSPKTAMNVWTVARAMCADAFASKNAELRCREDNPAAGVRGPDRGPKKAKAFMYPSEVEVLLACETVPLMWRRIVAVAVYSYLRAGELRVLRWSDIDLEHGIIHVHRAWDRRLKRAKETKGRAARRIPIEPALLPLLRAMHDEVDGEGLVLPDMPMKQQLAVGLRREMERAGLERAELYENTSTTKHLTFHDLRATGLTWMAVRGDDPLRIMARAGHVGFDTTQGYVRTAEAVGANFGEPFPPIPPCVEGIVHARSARAAESPMVSVASPGVEPGPSPHTLFRRHDP